MPPSPGSLRTSMTTLGCALVMALPCIAHAQKPNHYYNFDEASGTIVQDSGLTGGANATTGGSRSTNTPFSYSGNRSVNTGAANTSAPGFLVSPQFTLSLWGYYTPGATQYFLDSNGTGRTLIYSNSDHVYFAGQNLTNGSAGVTLPSSGSSWQNFVITRNGTTVKTYQNGVLKGTDTISLATGFTPTNWTFGSRQGGNEPLQGQIDEYAFWNSELSASQVSQVFTSGSLVLVAATPEPGSVAVLVAFGVAGTGLLSRSRRIKQRRSRNA